MSRTDLVADAFTMVRNAMMVKKENVDVPSSNTVKSILEILKKESYIENFKLIDDKKQGICRIYLKYIAGKPAIMKIKRISKPGLRVYAQKTDIPRVLGGLGIVIVSTSKGIMTGSQAKQAQLGGEILAYVW